MRVAFDIYDVLALSTVILIAWLVSVATILNPSAVDVIKRALEVIR